MSKIQEILKNVDFKLLSSIQSQTINSLQEKLSLSQVQLETMAQYANSLEIENEKLKNPTEVVEG